MLGPARAGTRERLWWYSLRWDSPAGLSGLRQGRTRSALLEVHWVGLVCPGTSSVSPTFQYSLFSVET